MKDFKATTGDNKKFIIDTLMATGRDGMDYVIEELDNLGFFSAPASTCHHLCEEGGLAEHSVNVYREAMMLRDQHVMMNPLLERYLPEDSVAIASLLHDVCKAEIYKKTNRKKKGIDGAWESFSSYEIDHSAFPCGHGEKSVIQLLRWGLDLTDDEILAIRWHMGPWDLAFQSLEQKTCLNLAKNTTPLLSLIQHADGLAASMLESKVI